MIVWKHLLNRTMVTEALNRPQKPHSQYPVQARASGGAGNHLLTNYFVMKFVPLCAF